MPVRVYLGGSVRAVGEVRWSNTSFSDCSNKRRQILHRQTPLLDNTQRHRLLQQEYSVQRWQQTACNAWPTLLHGQLTILGLYSWGDLSSGSVVGLQAASPKTFLFRRFISRLIYLTLYRRGPAKYRMSNIVTIIISIVVNIIIENSDNIVLSIAIVLLFCLLPIYYLLPPKKNVVFLNSLFVWLSVSLSLHDLA